MAENPRRIVLLTETTNDISEEGQVIERKIYLADAESYAAGLAARDAEVEKLRAIAHEAEVQRDDFRDRVIAILKLEMSAEDEEIFGTLAAALESKTGE